MSWWKETTFWKDWTAECRDFDKSIEKFIINRRFNRN